MIFRFSPRKNPCVHDATLCATTPSILINLVKISAIATEKIILGRAYLTRIFKSITSFTVKEYLILCRIRNAKTLLQTTSLSITEIAARTGFGNITNFEKNFKSMTSMTPLQYRKQK